MTADLQERIMLGGVMGSGKTYAWLTIARMYPNSKFYVIDPDDGARRVWFPEFPEVKNIEYYFTPRWYTKGFEEYQKKPSAIVTDKDRNCYLSGVADSWYLIKPKLREKDWIIVEHMGMIWPSALNGFTDEVFMKDIGSYFLEARKKMKPGSKKLDAMEGWTDWNVINKMHNDDFVIPICFENPAHVLMTTSVSIAQEGAKEDADIKAFYGDTKIRLEGQKHTPYKMQTIILMSANGKPKERKHYMTTFLKDRGRAWMDNKEWTDFALDYLVMEAGFEI